MSSLQARIDWILAYMRARTTSPEAPYRVDVLNSDFVWDYLQEHDAPCAVMPYGAPKCPRLGLDLSTMYERGLLKRHRTGIEGLAGQGFPRWVYSYRLP